MGTYHAVTQKKLLADSPLADEFFEKHNYTKSPMLVQWLATYRCSLSCPHCLCGNSTPEGELSLGEVEGLLDQVAVMNVREFLITGGEPAERGDLPEVVSMLHERAIQWSLNTSTYPNPATRRAMEAYPPAFVAVSLDGPEDFHDSFRGKRGAFRESLRAISLYAELTGGHVAAGTTLNAQNFNYLAETFGIVLESGATSWGLHLTFPEGRAAGRRELFLSKKQLRKLLSFIAAKRKYFPVTLADEIGYCGDWEPMVREAPFFCGAGRAQCVVLPDGEVVPCTTVDKSESAGSIRNRSLEEIWHSGFTEIRSYEPRGKCKSCRYAPACSGGCWLQRRHSNHCFRDVWHTPRALASAASIAVCLGLAACQQSEPVKSTPGEPRETAPVEAPPQPAPVEKAAEKTPRIAENPEELENLIIKWYSNFLGGWGVQKVDVKKLARERLGDDPAGRFFMDIMDSKHSGDLSERANRMRSCLETRYRSLSLSSLLWRDLTTWCLAGKAPAKRTSEERKLLKETLQALEKKTKEWRQEIFEEKLDPFLCPEKRAKMGRYMLTKASTRRRGPEQFLRAEHWGPPEETANRSMRKNFHITREYLAQHPFGETMRLSFEAPEGSGLKRLRIDGNEEIKSKDHIDIFDILVAPGKRGGKPVRITFKSGNNIFNVNLPRGTELLYGDVLRLAYEQNREEMDKMIKIISVRVIVPGPQPLFLPALEARMRKIESGEKIDARAKHILKWLILNIWHF